MGRAPASSLIRGHENSGARPALPFPEATTRTSRGLTKLGPTNRPFTYAQQLKDAPTRWLQPGDSDGKQQMLEQVILEQFMDPSKSDMFFTYLSSTGVAIHSAIFFFFFL